jgi:SAM-dependent methyltransferase
MKERIVVDKKAFWDAKILAWETGRYEKRNSSSGLLERIADRAGTSLRYRRALATKILSQYVQGRHVVEFGCGSGRLANDLIAAGAASYLGVDIAETAVREARRKSETSPDRDRINFEIGTVSYPVPEKTDLVFSLGLLDWLDDEEIDELLSKQVSHGGAFLHAFSEKRFSVKQVIHRLYVHFAYGHRTSGYVPRYYESADLLARIRPFTSSEINVIRDSRMDFGAFATTLFSPAPEP